MPSPPALPAHSEATFNAAAGHYDRPPLAFWDRFGHRTIERLPLARGMRVLDVCCGMGASALPAAERVGAAGQVTAVDLAQTLLQKGARRAAQRGLTNLNFRRANLEKLPFAEATFDAVVCAFGLFFASDLPTAIRGLWRLVAPGGLLALTVWGPEAFEPASGILWEAVCREGPEAFDPTNAGGQLMRPASLRALLSRCGVPDPEVVSEAGAHPLAAPEDWWTIVLGSGYRAMVEALSPAARARVRTQVVEEVRRQGVRDLRVDVTYAVARRTASEAAGFGRE